MKLAHRLGSVATVVDAGEPVDMQWISEDLYTRGVHRLMVEGGGTVHTQFLTADLVDELNLVVAPFFVGDSRARRFVSDGRFPWNPRRRATLAEVRQIGDVVLLRYALSPRFRAERRRLLGTGQSRERSPPGCRDGYVAWVGDRLTFGLPDERTGGPCATRGSGQPAG